jgi:hypothetical protein
VKKIKKPSKNEILGSIGAAVAVYAGGLAMGHHADAKQAETAAVVFEKQANVSGESGDVGLAKAHRESLTGALKSADYERGKMEEGVIIALVGLGLAGRGFGAQAREDSADRQAATTENAANTNLPAASMSPDFDDTTRRFHSISIPVPPPEATTVAKHRAA